MSATLVVLGVTVAIIAVIVLVLALRLARRLRATEDQYRRATLDPRQMGNDDDPADLFIIFRPEDGPSSGA
jgi:hypothetical protein